MALIDDGFLDFLAETFFANCLGWRGHLAEIARFTIRTRVCVGVENSHCEHRGFRGPADTESAGPPFKKHSIAQRGGFKKTRFRPVRPVGPSVQS
jgi:hypothetical protein